MEILSINHLAVISTNLDRTKTFLENIIGCTPHPQEGWFRLPGSETVVHVIDIEDAVIPNDEDLFHYYRHNALEVKDLREVCQRVLQAGCKPFQMDFHGEEKQIESVSDSLDFGLKTIFVRDPDGNLWEFAQRGFSWDRLWE